MTKNFDVRGMDPLKRERAAWAVHNLTDIKLPELRYWNWSLCEEHKDGWKHYREDGSEVWETERPPRGCRHCAIFPHAHQRVSIVWLYLKKNALLADTMGSGKTTSAGGLVAMLKETGELPEVGRVIIVPRASALDQWAQAMNRMIPGIDTVVARASSVKKRHEIYQQDWEVLLISPETLRRDFEILNKIPLALFLTDDIDQQRNPNIQTTWMLDYLGTRADRYVIMTGTPLHKRLPELHSVLDGLGGKALLGDLEHFTHRYIRTEWVTEVDPRTMQEHKHKRAVGYKNLRELKRKIAPLILRRTEFPDVTLPTILANDIELDLYPLQRARYNELKQGVVKLLREEQEKIKHVTAMTQIHYGSAICAGLVALGEPDGPGTSVKLDWIMEEVTNGAFLDEKVVIFIRLKDTIRALQKRLDDAGVGYVTVWGEGTRKDAAAAQERFWDDPNCQVLMGTQSIEQSLNLQVSRHLINMDLILNQARMEQLAGRIRRDGSKFDRVFVHNLLAKNTQETGYMRLLEREAALAGYVWGEASQLFQPLSAEALLHLIADA